MKDNQTTSAAPSPGQRWFWNDPFWRDLTFQALVIGGVILFCGYLVSNTLDNLESRGISSGFDFLTTTAGFSIGETHFGFSYHEEDSYGHTFLVGLLNTIWVSMWGILFAACLGFVIGVLRLSDNWLIVKITVVYIETLRNIPLLLQIFFWYFAILRPLPGPRQSVAWLDMIFLNNRGLYYPQVNPEAGFYLVGVALLVAIVSVIGFRHWAKAQQDKTGKQYPILTVSISLIVGLPLLVFLFMGSPINLDYPALKGFNFHGGAVISPEFIALLLALSTYTASFIAEIVRSGINSVSKGQSEACKALGLKRTQTLRLVIIPQAMRVIIPPLTNQFLNLTKNSSLAAAIAYPDLVLVFAGTSMMQTGQAIEIIGMTMAVYLTLSLLISMLMNWYNRKVALVER